MTKNDNLSERLKPIEELFRGASYRKESIQVAETEFETDLLIMTLVDKTQCAEATISLTKWEVSKYLDEFLEGVIKEVEYPVECPEFHYLKAFVETPAKVWLFDEIIDVLFWKTSPAYKRMSYISPIDNLQCA